MPHLNAANDRDKPVKMQSREKNHKRKDAMNMVELIRYGYLTATKRRVDEAISAFKNKKQGQFTIGEMIIANKLMKGDTDGIEYIGAK